MINSEAKKRIESFIQKIDDGDLEFTSNATLAKYGFQKEGILGTKTTGLSTLSDELADCLATYRSGILSDDVISSRMLDNCLKWINHAYMSKSVKPSEGIFRKYRESQAENEKLKQDNAEIFAELQAKIAEYADLHGRYKELNERISKYVIPLKDNEGI